jgi:hypothetical protein
MCLVNIEANRDHDINAAVNKSAVNTGKEITKNKKIKIKSV